MSSRVSIETRSTDTYSLCVHCTAAQEQEESQLEPAGSGMSRERNAK